MKKVIALLYTLAIITTMGACNSKKKETGPKIITEITPQNWAVAADYGDYVLETEPVIEETKPVETQPVIEETKPVETRPLIYYDIADVNYGLLVYEDLNVIEYNGVEYDLRTLTLDTILGWGFEKTTPVQNSGVMSPYYFDGYVYTNGTDTISVDADENGHVNAVGLRSAGFKIYNKSVNAKMPLADYYTTVIVAGMQRITPAPGVVMSHGLNNPGCVAYVQFNSEEITEIILFTSTYINSWGPIQ